MTVSTVNKSDSRHPPITERTFDGIICFGGGDWWYHNRGHYDMQMMRQFSRHMPILHVNSVGIRMPAIGEGRMFLRRISRKLRSLGRGFVRFSDNFNVISPWVIPGGVGMALSKPLLPPQVRWAAHRAGISRPLIWITCPPSVEFVDALRPVALIYQRTDRWEAFPETDQAMMLQYHHRLRDKADLTLFCAKMLFDEDAENCRNSCYVDHGVDFEQFARAGDDPQSEPQELKAIPHPRVGFIGGIDSHTFDPALLLDVARRLPQHQFVLVGGCSLPPGWCDLSNVHLLGQRPYESVAAYMAACDVLIMPWNQSDWIKACNPVKLKEYLAVGRPVVSTDFAELSQYNGYVRRAAGGEQFAAEICRALDEKNDPQHLRQRVRTETWEAKSQIVLGRLEQLGIHLQKSNLNSAAESKSKTVCVVGLGYVGLPMAAILASRGFTVHGVDVNEKAVQTINSGKAHIVEPDLDIVLRATVQTGNLKAHLAPARADVFVICVPTPCTSDHQPDMRFVFQATESICPFLQKGNLVILESTSPPGTTEQMARIIAQKTGLASPEIFLAHAPERILPGKVLREVVENHRIVGGIDEASTAAGAAFYRTFVSGELLLTNAKTAETAKLVENAFRDVNIAFANELSLLADDLGLDVWELIALANKHPRVNILSPGAGVGGHCIAVDPWFLVAQSPAVTRLIKTAREVNDSKPHWIISRVIKRAARLREPKIAVLGLAYKPDIDDLRESPAVEIARGLIDAKIGDIRVVEPNLPDHPCFKLVSVETAIADADIILVLVAHKEFKRLPSHLLEEKIIIDACGAFRHHRNGSA